MARDVGIECESWLRIGWLRGQLQGYSSILLPPSATRQLHFNECHRIDINVCIDCIVEEVNLSYAVQFLKRDRSNQTLPPSLMNARRPHLDRSCTTYMQIQEPICHAWSNSPTFDISPLRMFRERHRERLIDLAALS